MIEINKKETLKGVSFLLGEMKKDDVIQKAEYILHK